MSTIPARFKAIISPESPEHQPVEQTITRQEVYHRFWTLNPATQYPPTQYPPERAMPEFRTTAVRAD